MSTAHLNWLRQQTCVVPKCFGEPVHPHHVRTAATAGTGMKPPDEQSVPMCLRHHRELHERGNRTFEARYAVDLLDDAGRYAASSGPDMLF